MHKALERQLQKYLSDVDPSSPQWVKFINAVNETYLGFDEDRKLMNRSLDLSSKEFVEINEKLQQSRNKVLQEKAKDDAILESIGDGLIITDRTGQITLINKAAETMIGEDKSKITGKNFFDALNLLDEKGFRVTKENSAWAEALEKKTKVSSVHTLISGATTIGVSMIVAPFVMDSEVAGAVIALRDITKEQEIDRAKTEFVSLASHQLRTPLSTIGWYTETILSGEMGPLTEGQKEYLTEVYNANKRMTHLVKALLNVSRIDIGTLMAEPEEMDLREMTEIVYKDIEARIKSKNINYTVSIDPALPKIYSDPKLIQIIFQNILTNATKYTPNDGKVVLKVGVDPDNKDFFQIVVSDNGYGIPDEQKDKIFQKLFRADNVREKETDGTGLGLYLVKSIVDKVGGSIRFESKLNKGTTFYISMPMKTEKIAGSKKLSD